MSSRAFSRKKGKGKSEALKFLAVARKDFEAAKLCMERDSYPQALFMLQQSLEKTYKAIFLAIDPVSFEELRKIGHAIVAKGSEHLVRNIVGKSKSLSKFKRCVSDLKLRCPEAVELFDTLSKEVDRCIEQLNSVKVSLHNKVREIGRMALDEAGENTSKELERLDHAIDRHAEYLVEVTQFMKEYGVEDIMYKIKNNILSPLYRYVKEGRRTCTLKPKVNLEQLKAALEQYIKFLAQHIYLLDVYAFIGLCHFLFEANVSKLRYPDRDWTPTSISEKTILVIEGKKILKIIEDKKLFDIVEDIIKGEFKTKVGKKLVTHLQQLLNIWPRRVYRLMFFRLISTVFSTFPSMLTQFYGCIFRSWKVSIEGAQQKNRTYHRDPSS